MTPKGATFKVPRVRIVGLRAVWTCHITPQVLIDGGYTKTTNHNSRAGAAGTITADYDRFCETIGYTYNAFLQARNGRREPSETFRMRCARALGKPEGELFTRTIVEG